MWKRATWHECANELDQVCRTFRVAYWRRYHDNCDPRHLDAEDDLIEISRQGVQLLRSLALAVRSEQDFDLIPKADDTVGVLKQRGALPSDTSEVKQRGGYRHMLTISGYIPLGLREALNKVAHTDPTLADFFIGPGDSAHDLLLYGTNRGQTWFAVVSLLELVRVIRTLPDATIVGS